MPRYFVTYPVKGGTQWYDVSDRNPDGPLGLNGVHASFSVHVPRAEERALALRDELNAAEPLKWEPVSGAGYKRIA